MIAVIYSPDLGLELTVFRVCDRCGINMQISADSFRKQCDDCIDFDVFEWGRYDWLFSERNSE